MNMKIIHTFRQLLHLYISHEPLGHCFVYVQVMQRASGHMCTLTSNRYIRVNYFRGNRYVQNIKESFMFDQCPRVCSKLTDC